MGALVLRLGRGSSPAAVLCGLWVVALGARLIGRWRLWVVVA